ncbi:protein-L-isoaspartate(D-aspartate) O-methyltransferase [Streptomyces sp. DSM 44917]|uniref:Protein-L-isoaspartate(D-aspartate) O-methyltransferase n=1 Tax=Streptomyces boetiae TaxID=3075541 RepID=A0ABU2LA12_9ACTN|nr:protein-L-isoaspartate(D-aspartate) O-methyltransferase [Streptomyces sp. DSM 44917]MDT0308325.1 protein-L-isoaspartate(D-aspartate) O-methyltransferase [Streptomyces sp. DSM 44917]
MTIATRPPAELRRQLAETLAARGVLRDPRWRAAFASVPCEVFLDRRQEREPGHLETACAADRLAATAALLEAVGEPPAGRPVLEVVTGPGYATALLAHRFGEGRVVSVDGHGDRRAVREALERLRRAGQAPTLVAAKAAAGCPERAPFGAVAAHVWGCARLSPAWARQTVPGGRVVAGLGYGVAVLTAGEDGSAAGRFLPVLACELPASVTAPANSYIPALLVPLGPQVPVPMPVDLGAAVPRFLGALLHPDVATLVMRDADGRVVYGLVHPDSGSCARLAPQGDGTALVQYDGPRDLWAERAPLLAEWDRAGRPEPERYGLTVAADGGHTLWLDRPDGWTLPLPGRRCA